MTILQRTATVAGFELVQYWLVPLSYGICSARLCWCTPAIPHRSVSCMHQTGRELLCAWLQRHKLYSPL